MRTGASMVSMPSSPRYDCSVLMSTNSGMVNSRLNCFDSVALPTFTCRSPLTTSMRPSTLTFNSSGRNSPLGDERIKYYFSSSSRPTDVELNLVLLAAVVVLFDESTLSCRGGCCHRRQAEAGRCAPKARPINTAEFRKVRKVHAHARLRVHERRRRRRRGKDASVQPRFVEELVAPMAAFFFELAHAGAHAIVNAVGGRVRRAKTDEALIVAGIDRDGYDRTWMLLVTVVAAHCFSLRVTDLLALLPWMKEYLHTQCSCRCNRSHQTTSEIDERMNNQLKGENGAESRTH